MRRLVVVALALACSERPAPVAPSAPPASAPPAATAAPPAATSPGEATSGPAAPAGATASRPAPAGAPSAPAQAPTAPPTATPAPKPAQPPVASAPAAPTPPPPAAAPPSAPPATAAHASVGSDRCKGCHKIQHASWTASAHPAKGVDCEYCHGPGADYIPLKVMKDPAAARAAGLVIPGKERCVKCHPKWSDDLLAKAHAHRPK